MHTLVQSCKVGISSIRTTERLTHLRFLRLTVIFVNLLRPRLLSEAAKHATVLSLEVSTQTTLTLQSNCDVLHEGVVRTRPANSQEKKLGDAKLKSA